MYYVEEFEKKLLKEGINSSSVAAYISDIQAYEDYLSAINKKLDKANAADFEDYIKELNSTKSRSTVNRKLTSIKNYYKYLIEEGVIKTNPCSDFKSKKVERGELIYLSSKEINTFIELPKNDAAGLRDRAMLELLYASGLRVSELCSLNVSDLNLSIGFVSVHNSGKARAVPFGKPCLKAIKDYLNNSRALLLGINSDSEALFVSHLGERITRQGVWKIIKNYASELPYGDKISPSVIRNTFAAHLVINGADLKSLQELLGNDDIMAYEVYINLSKRRVMDVYYNCFPRV